MNIQHVKDFILRHFTYPLHGKKLIWKDKLRIFCDGGQPKWRWIPRTRKSGYDPHWAMWGFAVYWLGREINFSFGRDINGFYGRG